MGVSKLNTVSLYKTRRHCYTSTKLCFSQKSGSPYSGGTDKSLPPKASSKIEHDLQKKIATTKKNNSKVLTSIKDCLHSSQKGDVSGTNPLMSQKSSLPTGGTDESILPQAAVKTEKLAWNKNEDVAFGNDKQVSYNIDSPVLNSWDSDFFVDDDIPETQHHRLNQMAYKTEHSKGQFYPSYCSSKIYGLDFTRKPESPRDFNHNPELYYSARLSKKTGNSYTYMNADWTPKTVVYPPGHFEKQTSDNRTPSTQYYSYKTGNTAGQALTTPSNWVPPPQLCPAISSPSQNHTPNRQELGHFQKDNSYVYVKSIPTNWVPAKNLYSSGYFNKPLSVNWTPGIQYCPCSGKMGQTKESESSNWSVQQPSVPVSFENTASQINWISTPQYFAADLSGKTGDHRGNSQKLPSNWTTQYRVDTTAPVVGSSGWPDNQLTSQPVQPASASLASQFCQNSTGNSGHSFPQSAYNPSKPSIYDVRVISFFLALVFYQKFEIRLELGLT